MPWKSKRAMRAERTARNHLAMGSVPLENSFSSFQLVDHFQNQTTASTEALYIDQLVLEEGSTLDLNGLNVYVHQFADHGGSVLSGGGESTVVPEPTSMILAITAAGFGLRRWRRNACV